MNPRISIVLVIGGLIYMTYYYFGGSFRSKGVRFQIVGRGAETVMKTDAATFIIKDTPFPRAEQGGSFLAGPQCGGAGCRQDAFVMLNTGVSEQSPMSQLFMGALNASGFSEEVAKTIGYYIIPKKSWIDIWISGTAFAIGGDGKFVACGGARLMLEGRGDTVIIQANKPPRRK